MMTLVENDRLGFVEEHASLGGPFHSGGQNLALNVGSLFHKVLRAHAMVNSGNALLDDRALIQISCDEVGSCADDLNTALVRLVVRLGALERRQEGMVDVDDLAGHGLAQLGRENLHIAGENDELNIVLLDQAQDLLFLLGLGILGNGQVVELNAVVAGKTLVLVVVGDNEGDINGQLAGLCAEENVVKAVADLGDHDQGAQLAGDGADAVPVQLEVGSEGVERGLEVLRRLGLGRPKVHAHEKLFRDGVGELLEIQDVELLRRKHPRHGVHDAGLVRARERQDVIVSGRSHVECFIGG
ncbi:hypothetical protein CI238_00599 [Colletotrichum incanum]|uniref:Uncharacterized protein n=1 Tax=Colletotrichum incanum TaxID=1573173 RepID=A0A166M0V1_COLIC|nr:hypothetical protein CI238_00599 [Colletotrichum incanum]